MPQHKLRVKRLGSGAYELHLNGRIWDANYVPELREWVAYDTEDKDTAIGPYPTLRKVREVLTTTLKLNISPTKS
jgi:hypothetical protein